MDTKSLTYAELGVALGITAASAKRLAIRRGWHKTQGNDGKARVAVPIERLEAERAAPGDDASDAPGDDTPPVTGDDTSDVPGDTGDMSAAVAVLTRHIERLETELAGAVSERDVERAKAAQVAVLEAVLEIERTRLAEARTDADRARVEAERWREAASAPRGVWAAILKRFG